jgi:DNA-binding transcriptional ArsR family regulator
MSLVELFSALADPTRCRVVEMLHERPRPVHELAAAFDISRPAISRHLKVLKDAGLVVEEKTGRENVYSLQRAELKPMQDWLEKHRTAKAPKKAGKPKSIVDAAVVAPEPMPVDASDAPAATAPTPVVEPVSVAAIDAAKPKRRPRAPREVIAPPPVAAPQLSFFDL